MVLLLYARPGFGCMFISSLTVCPDMHSMSPIAGIGWGEGVTRLFPKLVEPLLKSP